MKRYLSVILLLPGVLSALQLGPWTTPLQIATDTVVNSVTTVYDAGAKTIVALWASSTNGDFNYSSQSSNHGASWGTPVQLDISGRNPNGANNVWAAYDPAYNTLVATWGALPTTEMSLTPTAVSSTDGGGSWQNPQRIGNDHSDRNSDVFISFDSSTNSADLYTQDLVATWQGVGYSAYPQAPFVSLSSDGGTTWPGDATLFPDGSGLVTYNVFSCFSSSGTSVFTWSDATNGSQEPVGVSQVGSVQTSFTLDVASMVVGDVFVSYNSVYNTFIASWVDTTDAPLFAVSSDGVTWQLISPSVEKIVSANENVYTAIDPVSGITFATWTGLPSSSSVSPLYYSYSEDGGFTWSIPSTITSDLAAPTDVFVSFDSGASQFVATWVNGTDNTPYSALFPVKPSLPTNFPGNLGRLATYLSSLGSTFTGPLLYLTHSQLEKALTAILPKPIAKFSAANTLLTMGHALERRVSRRMQNKTAPLASALDEGELVAYNLRENQEMAFGWGSASMPTNAPKKGEKTKVLELREENENALWGEGFGELSHQKSQDQIPAFHTRTGGLLIGLDSYLPNGKISTALAYAKSHIRTSMDKDQVDFYALGLYGIGYIGNGFIEAGIWGAYNQYRQDRHIVFPGFDEHAKSHFYGWQYAPHLRFGYDVKMSQKWILEPFVSSDLAILFQEGFSEHGALPYNMTQKRSTSQLWENTFGLDAYTWADKGWGSWFFRGGLAYMWKKGFGIGNLREAIVGQLPGFSVLAYHRAQNIFIPSVELFCRGKRGVFGSVNYEGQFGSSFMSNSVLGKLGVFF